MMEQRCRIQLREALGEANRWYCSQFHCREIRDPAILIEYFIKSGGARDFARRFNEAMGLANRWYCSEYYQRDVRDPELLWDYYLRASEGTGPRKRGAA
jgi:hypothetical protein